jgi:hypothetical protein
MDLQRVKELKLATPFRPFHVVLDNGERFLVDSAESVGVAPDGSRMGLWRQQGVVILTPDKVRDVDVAVVSLKRAE